MASFLFPTIAFNGMILTSPISIYHKMSYSLEAIGVIETPYQEKFAVPRQPGLVPSARAKLYLQGDANCPEAVRGLAEFSHLWLLFLFDRNLAAGWKPTVRPPRLGGNQRLGVFASRSSFRPNGIGLSVVELIAVHQQEKQVYLELGSADLVNGTPIIDIKPYITYADAIDARSSYAAEKPSQLAVVFSSSAQQALTQHPQASVVRAVISETLAQDPRPAYKKEHQDDKEYAVKLFDLDVKFRVIDQQVQVTTINFI